jgi:hypothetical protein
MKRFAFLAALLGLLPGCAPRPRAPALGQEPVYHNTAAGLRFLAPEGWAQVAKGEVPPGKQEKERLLVAYQRPTPGSNARLEVTCTDLAKGTDLAVYLAAPAFGVKSWQTAATAEALTAGGVASHRFIFTGRAGAEDLTREVVACRRGERVYFFTGLFQSGDTKARDEIRRAVASVLWDN